MNKSLVLSLALLIGLSIVSCDSEGRRISKAESIINHHLFETLPDYKSYESISLELDSIEEDWIAIPGIMDIANDYKDIVEKQNEVSNRIDDLKNEFDRTQKRVQNGFLNGDAEAFWNGVPELEKMRAQYSDLLIEDEEIGARVNNIADKLLLKIDSVANDKPFAGWHAIHKFRVNNSVGIATIMTNHYFLTPDLETIILHWNEEEDGKKPMLINVVETLLYFHKIELENNDLEATEERTANWDEME